MIVEFCLVVLLVWWLLRLSLLKTRAEVLFSKIPGPRAYPIIGSILSFRNFTKEDVSETLRKLSFQYGPVYLAWLGPKPVVFVRDPADVEVVTRLVHKPSLYQVLHQLLRQGLFTIRGDHWKHHRKILDPAFKMSILQDFIPQFVECSNTAVERLSAKLDEEFDVRSFMDRYAIEAINDTISGRPINDGKEISVIQEAILEITEILAKKNFNLIQQSFLFPFLPSGKRHDELISFIHSSTDDMVRKRKDKLLFTTNENNDTQIGVKKKRPLLDVLLEFSEKGCGFTDVDIRDEVNTFSLGAYDSTASALSFTIYCLSHNQHTQKHVCDEMQEIFGNSERDATYEDLKKMTYLEMVIKESMRIYPPTRYVSRHCYEELTLKSGYTIPADTMVVALVEATHHDPLVHPDPLKFDPDRFGSEHGTITPFSYYPFGTGPRNCIGQKYALLLMKAVMSRLLRSFHFLPSAIPLDLRHDLFLKSATGVNVRMKRRAKA